MVDILLQVCLAPDNVQLVSIAKKRRRNRKWKSAKETTCQTDLTNKKASIRQPATEPPHSMHFPHSLDEKSAVHKNGWSCNYYARRPTHRRSCGVTDPYCYESYTRERLPAVLLPLKLYLLQPLSQSTTTPDPGHLPPRGTSPTPECFRRSIILYFFVFRPSRIGLIANTKMP